MSGTPSRAKRWAEATARCMKAVELLEAARAELEGAQADLAEVRDEYQDWYDNLPESLQASPVGEKLEAVTELDIEFAELVDLDTVRSAVEEATDVNLPRGFGRD